MPVSREPIFHDRQCVIHETAQSTSSTTFVSVANATLTTGDLAQTGFYNIFFSIVIEASLNNTTATFQFLADGTPISGSERDLFLKVKDQEVGFTFLHCSSGIEAGTVFTVEYKTDKGTVTLEEFNFLIDGIPDSRAIE